MGAFEYAAAPLECPGPGFCPCIDEADIRADLNGDGCIDPADNALEDTTVLYFVVNSDDDNGNGLEDYLDDGAVANEDDLVEIRLSARCPPLDPATSWWSISWTEPDPPNPVLKVWPTPDKSDGHGGAGTPLPNGIPIVSWPPPGSVWLEALHTFDELDITLTITDNTFGGSVAGQSQPTKSTTITAKGPCTQPKSGPRYKFGALRNVANITAIEADITTRTLQPLCSEPNLKGDPATFVHINIAIDEPTWEDKAAWVQTGYCRKTKPSGLFGWSRTIFDGRYVEMQFGPRPRLDYLFLELDPPPAGTWNYRIEHKGQGLDCWEFLFDHGPFENSTVCRPYWEGKGGQQAQWLVEITHKENRIPGDPPPGNPCRFSECKYSLNFAVQPTDANFTPQDIGPLGPENWRNEYGLQRTGTKSFEVWDKFP